MKIYLNGKLVEANEAKISVFDRSYLFGEGLFETLRAYKGEVPFLDKHLARMEWSATFLGLPIPHPREIAEAVKKTLEANGLKEARIKIIFYIAGTHQMQRRIPFSIKYNIIIRK